MRTILLIILVLLLIGSLPVYPYSVGWGWYSPVGILIIIVLIFFLMGRV